METLLLSPSHVSLAAKLLKQGSLVAFPTETVYGLGAMVFHEEAIRSIFTVKGRPSDNPLIVHISHLEEVERIAIDIPPLFYKLADHFFPGPLTVVMSRHPSVPSLVSAHLDTIAIRMPSHPLALELIQAVGEPLVAPSANLSGRPSSTQALHVRSDFLGKIAAILDGGECSLGIESTVVSLLTPQPTLLRPGAISKEAIEEVLGEHVSQEGGVGSPGMKHRHYAPSIPVRLFFEKEHLLEHLAHNQELRIYVLATDPHLPIQSSQLTISSLYAELRLAEELGFDQIALCVEGPLRHHAGFLNRVQKASSALDLFRN